ncbi:MAG: class B sortase [Oscillospiraceae bacterium]|nr:class B sortase [Oscillospiraceae bacterium]
MQGRIKNKGKFISHIAVLFIIAAAVIIITQTTKENQNKDDNILRETSENYALDNSQIEISENDITNTTENIKITSETKKQTQPQTVQETTGPPVKVNNKVYQTKFDALRAKYSNNQDIIGILKIPGTLIFYPVAHYTDNDYYLNRNLYKQRSDVGSIFMDYEDSPDRSDPNIILYGHQMYSSDTMFHPLRYYTDENYFENHRYVIFNTIYEDNVWEVFSFMIANTSFYYIQVNFNSEDEFLSLASDIKNKSLYDTGVDVNPGDRILILSTCTNQDPNTRYVLAAKLIKNKDDIPTDILNQMNSAVDDYIK